MHRIVPVIRNRPRWQGGYEVGGNNEPGLSRILEHDDCLQFCGGQFGHDIFCIIPFPFGCAQRITEPSDPVQVHCEQASRTWKRIPLGFDPAGIVSSHSACYQKHAVTVAEYVFWQTPYGIPFGATVQRCSKRDQLAFIIVDCSNRETTHVVQFVHVPTIITV